MTDPVEASLPGAAPRIEQLAALLCKMALEREPAATASADVRESAEWLLAHGVSVGAALEAGPSPENLEEIAHEIHAAWRDGMLADGRPVAQDCLRWDTLWEKDRELDRYIAARVARLLLGVHGESVPPLPKQPAFQMDLQPLIARIRQQLGNELAQFVAQIIDLTLAEVDRTEIVPRNSGNAVGFGVQGPPQEKP